MKMSSPIFRACLGCTLSLASCIDRSWHTCDENNELSFLIVGDVVGKWYLEGRKSPRLEVDSEGHIRSKVDEFGCELGYRPLVVGDYNEEPIGTIGVSRITLEAAVVEPGRFSLSYESYKGEKYQYFGEIVSTDRMRFADTFREKPDTPLKWIDLYRQSDDSSTDTTTTSSTSYDHH